MMKKIALTLCLVSLLILCSCAKPDTAPTKPQDERVKQEYVFQFGDFHTPLQGQYLLDLHETIAQYADGSKELSRPQPVTLELPAGAAIVEVAANESFTDSKTYEATGTLDLYNLLLDTQYYWRAAADEASLASAAVSSFRTTAVAPRNIYLDGVTNVRDMGGYKAVDGKVVRQGLLYRGARLNTSSVDTLTLEITEDGIRTFTQELGIKTEIDFRKSADNENGAIPADGYLEGVKYVCCPWLHSTNKDPFHGDYTPLTQCFEVLADENNYPVYFHCNIGTDRTGTIAFLVNALLGVDKESLYKDYLFSNFGAIEETRDVSRLSNSIYSVVSRFSGDTLAQKTEKYLLSVGVTQAQIDAVRSILLESGT